MFWFLWVLYCNLLVKVAIHLVYHVISRIKIVMLDLFVFTCFFEGRLRMWGYIMSYLAHIYIYHRQLRHFVGGSKGVKQPTV